MLIHQLYCVFLIIVAISILPIESATISKKEKRLKRAKKQSSRANSGHNETKDKKMRMPKLKSLRSNCIDSDVQIEVDIVEGLCNNTRTYPTDKVIKQVKTMKNEFKHFFGVAARPYDPPKFYTRFLDIEESNMCDTRKLTYFPKMARNTNMIWRQIVQAHSFVQQVTIIKCLKEHRECKMKEAIPYHTTCKHQMITVRLVALDEQLKWIVEDFPIPGGCACFIQDKRL